jgi:hypothetical protein|tara:strand:- start:287 stop:490 length:204 start_codon:yes stop_codon:yes gene_type:complete
MTQQLITYDVHEFVAHDGQTVYSLWANFPNDVVSHCGHYRSEWKAKYEQERLEEFAANLLQAVKASF